MPFNTSQAANVARVHAAATTNSTPIKDAPGQVFGWHLHNNAAYAVFLKFYDSAASPTVGTDTPKFTVPVAAGGDADHEEVNGLLFDTGISYAITKLEADTDTTVVAAGDLDGEIAWQ